MGGAMRGIRSSPDRHPPRFMPEGRLPVLSWPMSIAEKGVHMRPKIPSFCPIRPPETRHPKKDFPP